MKPYLMRLDEAQNHRCCYCGHHTKTQPHLEGRPPPPNIPTKDHLEPCIYGGKTNEENLLIACRQCNNLRGEMEALAFYNLLQKWFRRDSTLRWRWYTLTRSELQTLKTQCDRVYAAQLNGRARRHREFAFRHHEFSLRLQEHNLWLLARARP